MNPRVMPRSFFLPVVFGFLVLSFFSVAAPVDERTSRPDPKRITVGPQIYADQLLKLNKANFYSLIR